MSEKVVMPKEELLFKLTMANNEVLYSTTKPRFANVPGSAQAYRKTYFSPEGTSDFEYEPVQVNLSNICTVERV